MFIALTNAHVRFLPYLNKMLPISGQDLNRLAYISGIFLRSDITHTSVTRSGVGGVLTQNIVLCDSAADTERDINADDILLLQLFVNFVYAS